MNIRITNLRLENFKCFRHKEISLENDVTTISGRNGEGKTTIADAILWTLFGKNTMGQSDFDLKTHDENGDAIPHLDHSVEMTILIDGREVSLKKVLKEVWIKKRGASEEVFKNNTTDYYVNGDNYTASDYKKYIVSLVSEDVFRAITNPSYFPSLKWQEQRQLLVNLVGEIDNNEVINSNELGELANILESSNEDIVAYRKHLSYQITEIKKKLKEIPVRLEELNRALPEKQDWESMQAMLNSKEEELRLIESQIMKFKQGDGESVKRMEINQQIRSKQDEINAYSLKVFNVYQSKVNEHHKKVNERTIKFNEALNNQRLMEQTIEADKRLIERCKQNDYESELQKLRDEWPSSKFSIDPSISVCPTCGQPIPEDMLRDKIEDMKANFNIRREEKIRELNEKAAKIKQEQKESKETLKELQAKLADDSSQLVSIKDEINNIFIEKAKLEKEKFPTPEETLATDKAYQKIVAECKELEKQLQNISTSDDDKEKVVELETSKSVVSDELKGLQEQLATKTQYERIMGFIDNIAEERNVLNNQLSELEQKEDIAREYEDRRNTILEEKVNKHFSITRWKMFRIINNGGEPFNEPYCECYDLNGTAYHNGLNQAARLNIGLDIINTLCRKYEVSAPIVLDNSESTINIIQTIGQQIRLQVADIDLTIR